MTTLVIGATGATGRLLVKQLLEHDQEVKLVARDLSEVPQDVRNHPNVTAIQASVSKLNNAEKSRLVKGCDAVAFCLGHNMTLRGLFGGPHKLVTDATREFCTAIRNNTPETPVKFLLMNTSGNSNRDLIEPISFMQKCVIVLLRLLLPPHVDNEHAAEHLRSSIGQNDAQIEWVIIRPDTLTDEKNVTAYTLHPSPIRSAIFDAGKTSRINVGNFMARLVSEENLWRRWRGQMPLVYNVD